LIETSFHKLKLISSEQHLQTNALIWLGKKIVENLVQIIIGLIIVALLIYFIGGHIAAFLI